MNDVTHVFAIRVKFYDVIYFFYLKGFFNFFKFSLFFSTVYVILIIERSNLIACILKIHMPTDTVT